MTTSAPLLIFDVSSDAAFRAWGSGISSALAAVGLVQTTDTGQINWTTVTRPTSGGAATISAGYEIWRFNDSLQSTKPVFIKLQYGVSLNAGNNSMWPSMWIQVGTGTNGAGTLTGVVGTQRNFMGAGTYGGSVPGSTTPSASSHCYFSGDGSYVAVGLGVDTYVPTAFANSGGFNQSLPLSAMFVVERTRNADGTSNGNGVVLLTNGNTAQVNSTAPTVQPYFQILSFTLSTVGSADGFVPIATPGNAFSTGTSGTNVYTLPIPVMSPAAEAQMLGALGCFQADFTTAQVVTLNVLGASHTYLAISQVGGTGGNSHSYAYTASSAAGNHALLMRYE